jgi:hypothetical protein
MASVESLRRYYVQLRAHGERLAGGLADLGRRAAVYHHLFEQSGGNHVFPLIAAHGALWAGGWFRLGLRLGSCLSLPYVWSDLRRERLKSLAAFADAFRDVNRHVCIETFASFHFTARFGRESRAAEVVEPSLLEALNRVHRAALADRVLPDSEKRAVYEAFFRHEQVQIVGPRIEAAMAAFDWPLMRSLALRPWIRFAYFPPLRGLVFRDFSRREERMANGLAAFDLAAAAGWSRVVETLSRYGVLPVAFFRNPTEHFADLAATG